MLREEGSAANSSPTTLAAARAVSEVVRDAQERLIFCANGALHKEVVRFKPTPRNLNYPGKLLGEEPKVAIVIEDDSSGGAKGKKEEAKEEKAEEDAVPKPDDAVAAQLRVYESWFPLRILSKIFPSWSPASSRTSRCRACSRARGASRRRACTSSGRAVAYTPTCSW